MIVVSDNDGLHFFTGNIVEAFSSSKNIFCLAELTILMEVGVDDALSFVENLLITMFNGSTSLAMQVSSGAKMIDRGLKS